MSSLRDHHLYTDHPDRMAHEENLMRARTRASLAIAADGELAWIEELRSVASGQLYRLAVVYPTGFGSGPIPRGYIVSPDVTGAPHRFADGSLCLFADHERGCGLRTSALLVRNRTIVWFFAYEVWARTGEWIQQ